MKNIIDDINNLDIDFTLLDDINNTKQELENKKLLILEENKKIQNFLSKRTLYLIKMIKYIIMKIIWN